mmetsp:Transcript_23721/g.36065  ORF Transcript_23721/g.36065 Transcript_23721/m.36065 type:complete len:90 (+) Transcript_23721:507-776(+)
MCHISIFKWVHKSLQSTSLTQYGNNLLGSASSSTRTRTRTGAQFQSVQNGESLRWHSLDLLRITDYHHQASPQILCAILGLVSAADEFE